MRMETKSSAKKNDNIAVILSGGKGERFGSSLPMQYVEVDKKMIIEYCMETIFLHEAIDAVCIVADENYHDRIVKAMKGLSLPTEKFIGFVPSGEIRQLSILNALNYIYERDDKNPEAASDGERVVLIHDAARPNLKAKQIDDLLECMTEFDGAMPVLPMRDTVYISEDKKTVSRLIDRGTVFAGQAPECFRLEMYRQANLALLPDDIYSIDGSTQPAILAGMNIAMIPGDEDNLKITTAGDLEWLKGRNER